VSASGNAPRLPILRAGADWLVVHKPSGLHTHPSALSPGEDSAARWLAQQLGQRVWPVHRLDRGASGLLLFAQSAEAAARLIGAFRERRVSKRYLCLARGWPGDGAGGWAQEGRIERPLADRDPGNPTGILREAVTNWRVLARVDAPFPSGSGSNAFPTTRVSLLECVPETGRMHQIRRHLAGIGHPLLGDGEHGSRPLNRILAREIGLERLALCCVELVVDLGETEPIRLTTVLDPDLRRVLEGLGLPDPTAGKEAPALFHGVLRTPGRGWRARVERRALLAAGEASRDLSERPRTPDPEQREAACVLCGAMAGPFHAEDGRSWRSCGACGLVQLDPACWPSREERDARLRLHHNDPADEGYRNWLRPLAEALARRLPAGSTGVDLGCGPVPLLAELLREAGLDARGWDPLFHPDPPPTPGQAWLCACEVFEHLEDPAGTLDQWAAWLRPGGWLALSTGLLLRDGHFPGWGYARDPAHLIVARPRTLEWLALSRGWRLEHDGRVVLFQAGREGSGAGDLQVEVGSSST
jgi:tRNA pseudouridine65 synthase